MKLLDVAAIKQISGGDVGVTIATNVPTADTAVFAGLLGNFLLGELDAASLAAAIAANAANFNDMQIQSIELGNFVITHK